MLKQTNPTTDFNTYKLPIISQQANNFNVYERILTKDVAPTIAISGPQLKKQQVHPRRFPTLPTANDMRRDHLGQPTTPMYPRSVPASYPRNSFDNTYFAYALTTEAAKMLHDNIETYYRELAEVTAADNLLLALLLSTHSEASKTSIRAHADFASFNEDIPTQSLQWWLISIKIHKHGNATMRLQGLRNLMNIKQGDAESHGSIMERIKDHHNDLKADFGILMTAPGETVAAYYIKTDQLITTTYLSAINRDFYDWPIKTLMQQNPTGRFNDADAVMATMHRYQETHLQTLAAGGPTTNPGRTGGRALAATTTTTTPTTRVPCVICTSLEQRATHSAMTCFINPLAKSGFDPARRQRAETSYRQRHGIDAVVPVVVPGPPPSNPPAAFVAQATPAPSSNVADMTTAFTNALGNFFKAEHGEA